MMSRSIALLLCLLFADSVPVASQSRSSSDHGRPWHSEAPDPADRGPVFSDGERSGPSADWSRFALYATAGSALGLLGGGSLGWYCCRPEHGGDTEQAAPVLLGAAAGSVLGTGLGLYLARPGAVPFSRILGGTLLGLVPAAAGMLLVSSTEASAPVYIVVFSLSHGITASVVSTR